MPIVQIYKPIGKTPLEMISLIKKKYKHYKNSKMSYAGRLDPMAHGLLIILIDEECKKQPLFQKLDKSYTFKLLIGISTDTYDSLGIICETKKENFTINLDLFIKIIKNFVGCHKQYYPPFSSQKINGKSLWYYAKNNLMKNIIIPSKFINIYKLDILNLKNISKNEILDTVNHNINKINNKNNFRQQEILEKWKIIPDINYYCVTISADVSSGTYIRTLCNDIGNKINIPCLAFDILRTKIDKYTLN